MKVMILCGGLGMRLRDHSEARPKPMLEIGGRPILWHIMKSFSRAGFREFILLLGYRGNVIKDYFLNYAAMNSDFTVRPGRRGSIEYHGGPDAESDWVVTLADTGEKAMTGARIRRGARHLGDERTFMVAYGDGLTDLDLNRLTEFHRGRGGLATMTGVRPPSRFGELRHEGGQVVAFSEKPQVTQGLINGGFFVFERGFLDYLTDGDDCVLEREPLERAARDGVLHVHVHSGYWQCMDNYRDWESLERQWNAGSPPWKTW